MNKCVKRLERWVHASSRRLEPCNVDNVVASYQRYIQDVIGALEDIQNARSHDPWLYAELGRVRRSLEEVLV